MNDPRSGASQGRLARGLKLLGQLTSPETESGKVFTRAEQRLTELSAKLAESPTWLRISGGLMGRVMEGRIRRQAAVERVVRTLRLPPASVVEALREQVRRMQDQVEALGTQVELIVELLEKQVAAPRASDVSRDPHSPPPPTTPDPSRPR